jgi:hypothetical protein
LALLTIKGGEMKRALIPACLLVFGSLVLGATLFKEPVAWAAQAVDAKIIGPLDGNGNVKVHEQGTAQVAGTVNVAKDSADDAPYEKTVTVVQSQATCSEFGCGVSFPAVPAGKRLVITYASADYVVTSDPAFAKVRLGFNGIGPASPQVMLPPPQKVGGGLFVTGGPVAFYVEPGDVPSMALEGVGLDNTDLYPAKASIVGYLVAS